MQQLRERILGLYLVILSRGLSYPRWARRAVTGGNYCVPSSSSFPWPGTKMWHCQVTKYLSVLRQTDFSPPPHTHTQKQHLRLKIRHNPSTADNAGDEEIPSVVGGPPSHCCQRIATQLRSECPIAGVKALYMGVIIPPSPLFTGPPPPSPQGGPALPAPRNGRPEFRRKSKIIFLMCPGFVRCFIAPGSRCSRFHPPGCRRVERGSRRGIS